MNTVKIIAALALWIMSAGAVFVFEGMNVDTKISDVVNKGV